jgi:hypothetical protein
VQLPNSNRFGGLFEESCCEVYDVFCYFLPQYSYSKHSQLDHIPVSTCGAASKDCSNGPLPLSRDLCLSAPRVGLAVLSLPASVSVTPAAGWESCPPPPLLTPPHYQKKRNARQTFVIFQRFPSLVLGSQRNTPIVLGTPAHEFLSISRTRRCRDGAIFLLPTFERNTDRHHQTREKNREEQTFPTIAAFSRDRAKTTTPPNTKHQTQREAESHPVITMNIDTSRRNRTARPLSDSERARLDEFIDLIHYSPR